MTGADAPTISGSAAPADNASAKMTFRGAARLVVAAKRFQAALNPTYTFGKRADSGDNAAATAISGWARTDGASSGGSFPSRTSSPVEIASAAAAKAAAVPGATTPPKVGTPPLLGTTPPKKVYDHHGHKGNLLMKPLPDVVVVAPAAAAEKA